MNFCFFDWLRKIFVFSFPYFSPQERTFCCKQSFDKPREMRVSEEKSGECWVPTSIRRGGEPNSELEGPKRNATSCTKSHLICRKIGVFRTDIKGPKTGTAPTDTAVSCFTQGPSHLELRELSSVAALLTSSLECMCCSSAFCQVIISAVPDTRLVELIGSEFCAMARVVVGAWPGHGKIWIFFERHAQDPYNPVIWHWNHIRVKEINVESETPSSPPPPNTARFFLRQARPWSASSWSDPGSA